MGRIRKELNRQETHWSTKPLYVIATEGKFTEEIYFNGLFRQKNIRMPILPTNKGKSSPDSVLRRLSKYRRKHNAEPNELWLVIDRDYWEKLTLEKIQRECISKGYNLIISNPCFELWILLHQQNPKQPLTVADCEKEVKKFIPNYTKSKFNINKLEGSVHLAISNAKRLNNKDAINNAPATKVFELVEKLNKEDDI